MKFLIDENIGISLVKYLREQGFDVKYVSELFPSRDDAFILKTSSEEERVIITNDKDFGYLTFNTKFPPPSVILFRFKEEIPSEKINAMKAIMNLPEEKIFNHFIVVSENKIRIRLIDILKS